MNIQVYQSLLQFDADGYEVPLLINDETAKYINIEYL
jgi:hypothetical protein